MRTTSASLGRTTTRSPKRKMKIRKTPSDWFVNHLIIGTRRSSFTSIAAQTGLLL